MKKLGIIIVIVLALIGAVVLGKNIIAKTAVEKGAKIVTGLDLKMDKFSIGILNTSVEIKGITLSNPPSFKDRIMIDMPEIYVDYDLGAILKKNIHLNEVRLTLNEFTVVKNERGELNLDSLKSVKAQKKAPEEKKPEEKSEMPKMQIDVLKLKIGTVYLKDYTGRRPSVKEFKINIDQQYTDITNPNELVNLIVVKALMNTTIAGITDFDLGGLQNTVSGTLSTATNVAGGSVEMAGKAVAGTAETAEKAVGEVGGALKKTGDTIKKIKLPFGGK